MYILVTIFNTLFLFLFFVKEEQIKTNTDLEGYNDDLS